MPAYFSIIIDIKKENKYDGIFADFVEVLKKNGFVFKSGFWGFENQPLEEIISWNEERLKEDFELGLDEHYSHGYRQICWDYHDFSEVRSYILNNRDRNHFSINIIIPENDFIAYEKGKEIYDNEIVRDLFELAVDIWEWGYVETIQTELELSDPPAMLESVENGEGPLVEPFAIIPLKYYSDLFGEKYRKQIIGRDGILLQRNLIK